MKALSINFRNDYKLSSLISNINKLYSTKSLVLNLDDYHGEPLAADHTDNLTEISTLCISARRIVLESYWPLFQFLLTNSIRKVTLILSDNTARPEQILELVSFVGGGKC